MGSNFSAVVGPCGAKNQKMVLTNVVQDDIFCLKMKNQHVLQKIPYPNVQFSLLKMCIQHLKTDQTANSCLHTLSSSIENGLISEQQTTLSPKIKDHRWGFFQGANKKPIQYQCLNAGHYMDMTPSVTVCWKMGH